MIVINQSVATLQYVRIQVNATVNGNTSYNPTSDTVQFAFLNTASNIQTTAPSSWVAASWETGGTTQSPIYVAKCLVGPGGTFVPSTATYWIWMKITDTPEIPVLFVGQLVVT